MKAVVLREYGPPSNLKYEDFDEPKLGAGEVLVKVGAVSINPVDVKMRSGEAKDRFPVEFPGIIGRDVAGVVREVGEGVTNFAPGDRVMALAQHTYAELCVVAADILAKIPEGVDISTASAVPLVSVTGDQIITDAAKVQKGDTVLITGALGSVGRCAVFSAVALGARVIVGVREKQLEEARKLPGITEAIALDDDDAFERLGLLDAVADTVGGALAPKLLGKVKQGGRFGSVLGPPKDAALHPTIEINAIMAHPDPATFIHYAEAIRDGHLALPIERLMPLADAAEAHELSEKGGLGGKVVLVA